MSDKSNVIELFDEEATADEILERAKGDLRDVLVLSYDKAGYIDVRSTNMTAAQVAFMCQQFLNKLYEGDYSE